MMQMVETSSQFWDALTLFISEYNIYVSGLIGFAFLFNIIVLIILFLRMGYYGSNPQKCRETMNELLVCFVCFAVLGGVTSLYVYALMIILK